MTVIINREFCSYLKKKKKSLKKSDILKFKALGNVFFNFSKIPGKLVYYGYIFRYLIIILIFMNNSNRNYVLQKYCLFTQKVYLSLQLYL